MPNKSEIERIAEGPKLFGCAPIESAPRDGSTILAGTLSPWGTMNLHAAQSRWSEALGRWAYSCPVNSGDGQSYDPQPTHWAYPHTPSLQDQS